MGVFCGVPLRAIQPQMCIYIAISRNDVESDRRLDIQTFLSVDPDNQLRSENVSPAYPRFNFQVHPFVHLKHAKIVFIQRPAVVGCRDSAIRHIRHGGHQMPVWSDPDGQGWWVGGPFLRRSEIGVVELENVCIVFSGFVVRACHVIIRAGLKTL